MSTKDNNQLLQLQATAVLLHTKIQNTEDRIARAQFRELVGRCFTRKDSYGDSRSWPTYSRIFRYIGGSRVEVESFARRVDNTVTYEPAQHLSMCQFTDGRWLELKLSEYWHAKEQVVKFMRRHRPMLLRKRKR
jgi:hypothetical protein